MNGAQRLAQRREQEARAPVVLQGGFRPFFLASAVWFPVALALWLATLVGAMELASPFSPVAWHRHELIFGGVGAAMTGYLLTATPNWSGRLPTIGVPLLIMLMWWMLARAANAAAGQFGPWPANIVDTGYFLALAAMCGRESWHGKGRGALNAILVAAFGIACAASHLAAAGIIEAQISSTRAGISIIIVLISLIGGKLVPSFTQNALPRSARATITAQETRFDRLANWGTGLACLLFVADAGIVARVGLAIAGLLQLVRAIRWRPWQIINEPSVLALHIGYDLLPLGLLGLAVMADRHQTDVFHLLTAGAISCMVLAVMARMTIAQTGRSPRWRLAPLIAVLFAFTGAVIRVASGSGLIPAREVWTLAGLVWMLGFALFLTGFGPILFRPRAKRK